MISDGYFVENEIIAENMSKLSASQSLSCERRICEVRDLAYEAAIAISEMFSDGMTIYEVLEILAQEIDLSLPGVHEDALEENRKRLSSYFSTLSAYDKAVFSELLCEAVNNCDMSVTEHDFLHSGKSGERIVYVKNRLADEAYDVFSQELTYPTVSYVQTFKEATRAVVEGRAEYCILPLEERGGSRLSGITAMLFSDDLKINSVTPVFGFDGSADMKYALVSKHFTVPQIDSDDDRYLEIQLRADMAISLSELFTAGDTLGVSVYRVNTVMFDTEDGAKTYYSVVFKSTERDFTSLLVFLTMFSGVYSAIGIYKNLE